MSQNLEFPCKSCGAKLGFAPGATQLKCDYCGFTEAIPTRPEEVREQDFEDYKPDNKQGLGTDRRAFKCEQCGASTMVDPHVSSYLCAFCSSNQVVPQENAVTLHTPESVLPFVVEQREVLEKFRVWIKGLWFRPSELKKQARADRVQGIYLPFWTYDSLTNSWWTADAGYYYNETNDQGEEVRKTRWEPASGTHSKFFDDVLIQASPSVEPGLIRSLEPFDTKKLVPYSPEFLSGMAAEDYRSDMLECWPDARSRINSVIKSECGRMVPGDTHRNLSVTTSFLNRTFKLCLLPIWIASYRYQNKPYTYVVNGQTGKITGVAPYSWIKITAFILTIAAIIGAIAFSQM